ncbi:unnamed protein product [Effrenium voratum]|uniref:Uncharacterized protein n=1 Tax=Effrenium voratum TaxID=2562239 RepID=A0AA36IMV3_9DINO|nr:unnamed protein product [Effrenium voratum]
MSLSNAAREEIEAAVRHAEETGQVVQAHHQLLAALKRHGLIREGVQLEPDQIACSPLNRDGFGLSGPDIHELVEKVAQVGWNDGEARGICLELAPHDQQVIAFNKKLCEDSGGLIPPINEISMRYASLAGSHTNAMLRALRHEALHPQSGPLCVDGHLSLARVEAIDAGFAEAARCGMRWKVISLEVMCVSGVSELVQSACNTGSQLAKGEHEFQMLKRILSMIQVNQNAEWDKVKLRILASKPMCASACPYMFTFLMRFYQADLFARAEERVKRSLRTGQLGSDFYAALSGNCKDQSQQHMHFRYAVFSQAYASEKKMIAAADVKRMLVAQDLQPGILKAQDLMQKMRPLVREAGLQALEALDKFEDTLVLIALQKVKGLDMSEACSKLVDEVQALTGKRICEEYGQRRESSSGSSKAEQQRAYDSEGELRDQSVLLKEKGLQVGSYVVRKKDKARGQIRSMESSVVVLTIETESISGVCKVAVASFLRGDWKIVKKPAESLEFSWPVYKDFAGTNSNLLQLMGVRGRVAQAVLQAGRKFEHTMEGLKLQVKPMRNVVCQQSFPKGKMVLAPSSHKLETKPGGLPLGKIDGVQLFIHSSFSPPGKDGSLDRSVLCPFFMVRKTDQEEEANCVISPMFGDGEDNSAVKIPLMINQRALSAGESLLLFSPKPEESEPEELKVEPPAPEQRQRKRQKSAP